MLTLTTFAKFGFLASIPTLYLINSEKTIDKRFMCAMSVFLTTTGFLSQFMWIMEHCIWLIITHNARHCLRTPVTSVQVDNSHNYPTVLLRPKHCYMEQFKKMETYYRYYSSSVARTMEMGSSDAPKG